MARYALTILLGSFLLFLVQPMVGKYILPWFGGTPAVWTTCMLSFQVMLLAGYGYAHGLATWLSPRRQGMLHLVLLTGSILLLPITPSEAWKPVGDESPTWRILCLLAVSIGAPYVLLASTSPLMQSWFSKTHPGRSPYRLYALSNFGSLAALLSYPFLVEPALRLGVQAWSWSLAYAAFAALAGVCAVGMYCAKPVPSILNPSRDREGAVPAVTTPNPSRDREGAVYSVADVEAMASASPACPSGAQPLPHGRGSDLEGGRGSDSEGGRDLAYDGAPPARPAGIDQALWLALSACGSVLLLATTNQMCQEVAVVPFLWVVPLALYLVTFIICFDHERWYRRAVFGPLWFACVVGGGVLLTVAGMTKLWIQIAGFSAIMFVGCMVCHGELVRLKPHPRWLTQFYLLIAVGGALGGVLVTLVAPLVTIVAPIIFTGYWEYHAGLALTLMLLLAAIERGRIQQRPRPRRRWTWYATAAVLGFVIGGLAALAMSDMRLSVARSRNFYGLLQVSRRWQTENGEYRLLRHGRITHGYQFIDPKKRRWPTSYYGTESGVGMAVRHHPRRAGDDGEEGPLRIGVIGLGVGTMAAHGRPGDRIRFYEINPDVIRFSDEYFTYRRDSRAKVDVVLGDGRISLERALAAGRPEKFDVLVVDAFSSDAIPMHLLTRECFAIYWKHLKPDGILAVHVTNRNIDLCGVVRGLAAEGDHEAVFFDTPGDDARGLDSADWILVTSNREFLDQPVIRKAQTPWPKDTPKPTVWTDDFSNLFEVLK